MKFDIEKRNKIKSVLDRALYINLQISNNRTMIADLITKELWGDDEGYLNSTAYGDKKPVVKKEPVVEEVVKEEPVVKEFVKKSEPVVSKDISTGELKSKRKRPTPKRRPKKNVTSRP